MMALMVQAIIIFLVLAGLYLAHNLCIALLTWCCLGAKKAGHWVLGVLNGEAGKAGEKLLDTSER